MATTVIANVSVAESSSVLAGTPVSATAVVRADQHINLIVTPKTVLVTFLGSERRGTARLLLRGEALKRTNQLIRSITCEGFQVKWMLSQPTASNTAILMLIFEEVGPVSASQSELHLELEGKARIRLPMVAIKLANNRS